MTVFYNFFLCPCVRLSVCLSVACLLCVCVFSSALCYEQSDKLREWNVTEVACTMAERELAVLSAYLYTIDLWERNGEKWEMKNGKRGKNQVFCIVCSKWHHLTKLISAHTCRQFLLVLCLCRVSPAHVWKLFMIPDTTVSRLYFSSVVSTEASCSKLCSRRGAVV